MHTESIKIGHPSEKHQGTRWRPNPIWPPPEWGLGSCLFNQMRYKYKFDVDFRLFLTENNLETHINTYIYNWVYPTAVPGLSTSDNLIFVKHLNGQNVRRNCSN